MGLQIYPETVREVLIEHPIYDFLTGKFSMTTKFDRNQNQYVEINLELKKGKKENPWLNKLVLSRIVSNLREKNSEFRELSDYLKERAYPKLNFWAAENPVYFRPGTKQIWVRK